MDEITYEYECGCKATYTKYEVLHLEVEPNWGCNECGEGDLVVGIEEAFTAETVVEAVTKEKGGSNGKKARR